MGHAEAYNEWVVGTGRGENQAKPGMSPAPEQTYDAREARISPSLPGGKMNTSILRNSDIKQSVT